MGREIFCRWQECRAVDAGTRETLRRGIDPEAVLAAVAAFFLEKSGVETTEYFPAGVPPRRLAGWELHHGGLLASEDWRSVKFLCFLTGVDCDGARLRRAVAGFFAALPAFWVAGSGSDPVILSSLVPAENPEFAETARAGREVWQVTCPLHISVLAAPGVTLR